MLEKLNHHWQARRVLLLGSAEGLTPFVEALLTELGAKPARLPCSGSPETLCRALQAGRISAVILPELQSLCPEGSAIRQLSTLVTLFTEIREAGVPLTLLASDAGVYRASQHPGYAREEDPIGGQTQEGLIQSLLQLYADGISRGLGGDAVRTLIVRHMPCLFCGNEQVMQCSLWCRALMSGEVVPVVNPSMRGVFLHPLDIALGILLLGARFFAGEAPDSGFFHLGAGAQNLCANRSAALRLIARHKGTRPIRERESPALSAPALLDGSRTRLFTGYRCQMTGDEALDDLYDLEYAAHQGPGALQDTMKDQVRRYLSRLQ